MCKLSASFGSSEWSRIQSHRRPKLTSPLTITLESSSSTGFLWMYAWSTTTKANSVIIPELNHFGYKEAESVATFFFSLLFVRLIKRETNITTDYLVKLCKYIALSLLLLRRNWRSFRIMGLELAFSDWKWQCERMALEIENIYSIWNLSVWRSKWLLFTRCYFLFHLHVNFMSFHSFLSGIWIHEMFGSFNQLHCCAR